MLRSRVSAHPPPPDKELRHRILQALRDQDNRVFRLCHRGHPLIVKRPARRRRALIASLLLAWFCKRIIGQRPALAHLRPPVGAAQLQREADRLLTLARHDVPVPRIFALGEECLVLEDLGETAEIMSRRLSPAQRLTLLRRLARDLGRFHVAGHWHGGAQLRNLVVRERVYRIDFEEDLGEALPLPVIQSFDLLLFITSCVPRNHPNSVELLTLLHDYADLRSRSEVWRFLAAALPYLHALAKPVSRWPGAFGRDGQRLLTLSLALDRFYGQRSGLFKN